MRQTKQQCLIGYVRVSTEEQYLEGNSIEAQTATLEQWTKLHGHVLKEVVRDVGKSGSLPPAKRQGLQSALTTIRSKQADGLIFVKLDRLTRRLMDLLIILDECKRRGWHIISCGDNLDTSTVMGAAFVQMMGLFAEMEVARTSERVKHGLAHLTRQKRVYGLWAPWGYRIGEEDGPWRTPARPKDAAGKRTGEPCQGTLVENPAEQAILAWLKDYTAQGGTPWKAARLLNERQVPHPRQAKAWQHSTLRAILEGARRRDDILTQAPTS